MQISRRFTNEIDGPYSEIVFKSVKSELRHLDGSIMSATEEFKVPESFSKVAADILARKYL